MAAAQQHIQSTVLGELISCVLLWGSYSDDALGTAVIVCLLEASGSALPFCCRSSSRAAGAEFCLRFCISLCWGGEGTSWAVPLGAEGAGLVAAAAPESVLLILLPWRGGSTCLRALCICSRRLLLFFFPHLILYFHLGLLCKQAGRWAAWWSWTRSWPEALCICSCLMSAPLSWSIYSWELSGNLKSVLWKLAETFFKCSLVPAVLVERSGCSHQCINYAFLLLLILVKDCHDRCPGY